MYMYWFQSSAMITIKTVRKEFRKLLKFVLGQVSASPRSKAS